VLAGGLEQALVLAIRAVALRIWPAVSSACRARAFEVVGDLLEGALTDSKPASASDSAGSPSAA
jgi:hypothetical protein